MQVNVTFRHMEATEALKDFAKDKVAHAQKYVHSPITANVVLSVEKYMHKADITLKVHGMTIRGKEKSEDMYGSIDKALVKIERQMMRYKNKLNKNRQKEGYEAKVNFEVLQYKAGHELVETMTEQSIEEVLPAEIIQTKELSMQTMDIDEAIMQMDLMNAGFFVFINKKTKQSNILYRRETGLLGLLHIPHIQ